MYSKEIQSQLEKYAKRDLAAARKHNSVIVGRTKVGNITIRYNDKAYTMMAANMQTAEVTMLYCGKAAGAISTLTESYDVII